MLSLFSVMQSGGEGSECQRVMSSTLVQKYDKTTCIFSFCWMACLLALSWTVAWSFCLSNIFLSLHIRLKMCLIAKQLHYPAFISTPGHFFICPSIVLPGSISYSVSRPSTPHLICSFPQQYKTWYPWIFFVSILPCLWYSSLCSQWLGSFLSTYT